MYELIGEDALFLMLYTAGAMMSLLSSCYLLLRRGNAIAPDVTSPKRLRRWTAALFAAMTMSHVWYMPTLFLTPSEDILLNNIVGAVLDFMTLIPLAIVVLLVMLQDRRRPLWPVFAMMVPIIMGLVVCGASRSLALLPIVSTYYLLLGIGIIIYMVCALRQYGRWLRDNYADLEHKELWQSFVLLGIMLLVFVIYAFENQAPANKYVSQLSGVILICILLWRVETLSDLWQVDRFTTQSVEPITCPPDSVEEEELPQTIHDKIGPLLQQYCIDSQLYLQHELTIHQLARAVGTNRYYLSQYFSGQGITYNAYINNLRINHFISLYREAVAAQRPFTAQQLAHESGYRSYSTFGIAFKQRMGQTVTAWMHDTANHQQPDFENQQKSF